MKKRPYFIILIVALAAAMLTGCRQSGNSTDNRSIRVVSLSPAITDIIIDLGYKSTLVGTTEYCEITPDMQCLQIGTLMDINLEQLYLLKPDIIFLTPYHSSLFPKLKELSISYKSINLETTEDIIKAISIIGNYFNDPSAAGSYENKINDTIKRYRQLSMHHEKRSVILVVAREAGMVTSFYAVGGNNFLNEVIEYLNCYNPLSGYMPSYPLISSEELYRINPDAIIELYADSRLNDREMIKRVQDWGRFARLKAVKENCVFLINEPYIVRPSTKIVYIIRDIYNILNRDNGAEHEDS